MKKRYKRMIKTIQNDIEYKEWLQKASENDNKFEKEKDMNAIIAMKHGKEHAKKVAENTKRLLTELNCDEDMIALGYIAGLLHDIGVSECKKGHAEIGYKIARNYLEKFIDMEEKERELILHAILFHGSANEVISPIDVCIAIADKVDYDRSRAVNRKISPVGRIETSRVDILNNKLIMQYIVTKEYTNEAFYVIPKSIDVPRQVAEKMGWIMEVYINGKKENFEDRTSYQGFIYGK